MKFQIETYTPSWVLLPYIILFGCHLQVKNVGLLEFSSFDFFFLYFYSTSGPLWYIRPFELEDASGWMFVGKICGILYRRVLNLSDLQCGFLMSLLLISSLFVKFINHLQVRLLEVNMVSFPQKYRKYQNDKFR